MKEAEGVKELEGVKEPVIWNTELPELTIDELFLAQGADYSRRPPRPGMVELNRRILQEAIGLAHPAAAWNEVRVTGATVNELFLDDGLTLRSRLLAKVAGTADNLILFVMTIGISLETRATNYSKAKQVSEAFILDAAGSALLAKSTTEALERIKELYTTKGMRASFPLGPGHSYWPGLEDVRLITDLVHADRIGIRLTESNLMIPRKSIAFVMGVGKDLPDFEGKTHCDFCSLRKTCHIKKFAEKC